jgi:hypothetical protein
MISHRDSVICDMDYSLLLLCSSRRQCPLIGSPSLGDNFEFETFRSWQREKKPAGRKRKMVEAEASAVCKEDLCPLG